ncbi:hypothetical protein ADK54_02800 [Streptomyces sp. WM6378]|nr:hypothetical protein ADK54_02800 [Streptomyces sp. WM6378]
MDQALRELHAAGVVADGVAGRVVAPVRQWGFSPPVPTASAQAAARTLRVMIYNDILRPGELLTPSDVAACLAVRYNRLDIGDALIELAAGGLVTPQAEPRGFIVRCRQHPRRRQQS